MVIDKENAVHLAVNVLKQKFDEIMKKSAYKEHFAKDITTAQERAIRKSLDMAVKMAMMK